MFLIVSVACLCASAQQTGDKEKDHVRVTLNDGSVVEGYVQTYWVDGKLFKRMNTSFTMSPSADGKDARQYDAGKVRSIDFVQKTSADGRYDHLESMLVANPSVFKPKATRRQFVYKEGAGKVGDIYWWNGVDSQKNAARKDEHIHDLRHLSQWRQCCRAVYDGQRDKP